MSSTLTNSSDDRLISRLLIGKPDITPAQVKQLVPATRALDDHALSQKIEHLTRANAKRRPLANRSKRGATQ
ncbi:hypothetical protein [Ciceribacter sp. T2.26MG-112.2]|uniref:hypothetical protein n=1 Tax=Ciceribacter sp. T2.26MG-112.2 TaxID=3137154 RepID=UPI0012B68B63|nr:hypothetical protein [Ciceribacter naphthalenivorans]